MIKMTPSMMLKSAQIAAAGVVISVTLCLSIAGIFLMSNRVMIVIQQGTHTTQPPHSLTSNIQQLTFEYGDHSRSQDGGSSVSDFRNLAEPILYTPRVIYNRVPKCGSETVRHVIGVLSDRGRFNIMSSIIYHDYNVTHSEQERIVSKVMSASPLMMYERHIHWLNFTSFGHASQVYINVIREPIDRLVSWYYFTRFEPRVLSQFPMSEARRAMTYDECVQNRDPECVNVINYFQIIPYFCGQAPHCRVPSKLALETAKMNVEKYFPVVGLTSDLSNFFYVLDYKIPNFFRDSYSLYKQLGNAFWARYKTPHKDPPSDRVKDYMFDKLTYEYEFYYYIKQRFYRQLYMIKQKINDQNNHGTHTVL